MKGTEAVVEVRNKINAGQEIEVLTRQGPAKSDVIASISDLEGMPQECAQPNAIVKLILSGTYSSNDLIRIDKESTYAS